MGRNWEENLVHNNAKRKKISATQANAFFISEGGEF